MLVSVKVLLIGDSEAGAVSPYVSSVLRPGETISVSSVVGSRIQAWSNGQLAAAVAQAQPDVVAVFLGTNDYWATSSPNLAPIFAQLPARAIWVGPTAVQGRAWPISTWIQNACASRGVPFVNTEALGIPLRDGIHPTAAGAVKWLQAIWPLVEQESTAPAPVSSVSYAIVAGLAAGVLGYVLWDS